MKRKMKVLSDRPTVMFDVDDTLLMWNIHPDDTDLIEVATDEFTQVLNPHREHIEQLIKHAKRNHHVIVWSQGGAAWAHAAVKALGLEQYVDVVMNKPAWYYDDLHAAHWIGDAKYMEAHKYLKRDHGTPQEY